MCRVGPIALTDRLGIAGEEQQFRRRRHRGQRCGKPSERVEQVVSRRDIEVARRDRRRVEHVLTPVSAPRSAVLSPPSSSTEGASTRESHRGAGRTRSPPRSPPAPAMSCRLWYRPGSIHEWARSARRTNREYPVSTLGRAYGLYRNSVSTLHLWHFGCGDPVPGVVPRRGGQHRMRFGRMLGVRRVGGVGGVEVGVEAQRVVGVALQGSDAVVMRTGPGCR